MTTKTQIHLFRSITQEEAREQLKKYPSIHGKGKNKGNYLPLCVSRDEQGKFSFTDGSGFCKVTGSPSLERLVQSMHGGISAYSSQYEKEIVPVVYSVEESQHQRPRGLTAEELEELQGVYLKRYRVKSLK